MQKELVISGTLLTLFLTTACTQPVYMTEYEYVEIPVEVKQYNPRITELMDQLAYVKSELESIEKRLPSAKSKERRMLKKKREVLFVKQLQLFDQLGSIGEKK